MLARSVRLTWRRFHHIKNLNKRKHIVQWAHELRLGGYSKPGFPGTQCSGKKCRCARSILRRFCQRGGWQLCWDHSKHLPSASAPMQKCMQVAVVATAAPSHCFCAAYCRHHRVRGRARRCAGVPAAPPCPEVAGQPRSDVRESVRSAFVFRPWQSMHGAMTTSPTTFGKLQLGPRLLPLALSGDGSARRGDRASRGCRGARRRC